LERDDPTAARAELARLHEADPTSWYGLLAQGDVVALNDRDGRFPAAPSPTVGGRSASLASAFHTPAPWDDLPSTPGAPAWSSMGAAGLWRPVALPLLPPALLRAPAGYPAGPLFHPELAQRTLDDLAARAADPDLTAVADLAAAGHDALTGPMFAAWYDRLRARANRGDRRAQELSRSLTSDAWREVFARVRDHHHVARVTWAAATDPRRGETHADRQAIEQLAWPIAHGNQVWRAAAPVDLDPYLALSIMRAESTYNANAVSRVGARGPMQIMPRTGHLLAARMGVPRFSARDLHDPDVAVAFGVRYLGLLSDRFDGVWPLAVAAYNAGPHNVAAWRAGVGEGAPVDLFVELIPFTETRDYVKKVASFYATYLRLYQPDAEVRVPDRVAADHPEIVDF
jgi:soluble lytic murein transglycosylase-like protein